MLASAGGRAASGSGRCVGFAQPQRRPVRGAAAAAAAPPPTLTAAGTTAARTRRVRIARATPPTDGGAEGDDGAGPSSSDSIDALAAMLSQRAAEMRASIDDLDDPLEEPALPAPPPQIPPAAAAAAAAAAARVAAAEDAAEDAVLRAVGAGGFAGADFALVQQLGRLSVGRAAPPAPPRARASGPPAPPPAAAVAAVAYAARYEPPGNPFQQPAPVLLKEYLQRALALNELLAVARLQEAQGDAADEEEDGGGEDQGGGAGQQGEAGGVSARRLARLQRPALPNGKWRAATRPPRPGEPPVVPLLGYFDAPPSASAREAMGLPPALRSGEEEGEGAEEDEEEGRRRPPPPPENTFWLVYRWEGMRPLSSFMDDAEPLPMPAAIRVAERRLSQNGGENEAGGGGGGGGNSAGAGLFARAMRALRRAGPSRAEAALARRAAFLRACAAGSLAALAHCHGRGVAHGSLGSGCVMLSSTGADDALGGGAGASSGRGASASGGRSAGAPLRVKLDNFGLATVGPSRGGGAEADAAAEAVAEAVAATEVGGGGGGGGQRRTLGEARATDLQALGATLAEAFVVGLSCYGGGGGDWSSEEDEDSDGAARGGGGGDPRPPPSPPLRGAALQRLLFQMYGPDDKIRASVDRDDRSTLRAYLLQEPSGAYAPLVAFLDEGGGGGWQLLAALVAGATPAALLLSAHAQWLRGGGSDD